MLNRLNILTCNTVEKHRWACLNAAIPFAQINRILNAVEPQMIARENFTFLLRY